MARLDSIDPTTNGRPNQLGMLCTSVADMLSKTAFPTKTVYDSTDVGREIFLTDSGQTWELTAYSPKAFGLKKPAPKENQCDYAAIGNVNLSAVTASMVDFGGATPAAGTFVLLCPSQTDTTQNGVYLVTWSGTSGTAARVAWLNHDAQAALGTRTINVMNGASGSAAFQQNGTVLAALSYLKTSVIDSRKAKGETLVSEDKLSTLNGSQDASFWLSALGLQPQFDVNLISALPTAYSPVGTKAVVAALDPVLNGVVYNLTEDSSNGNHFINTSIDGGWVPHSGTFELEVNVKAAGRTQIQVLCDYLSGISSYSIQVLFDLAALSATPTLTTGLIGTSITPVANGWYKIKMQMDAGGNAALRFYLASGGSSSYAGDNASGVLMTNPIVRRNRDYTGCSEGNSRTFLTQSTLQYQPSLGTDSLGNPCFNFANCSGGNYYTTTYALRMAFASAASPFTLIWFGRIQSPTPHTAGDCVVMKAQDGSSHSLSLAISNAAGYPSFKCTQVTGSTITAQSAYVGTVPSVIALVCNGSSAQWYVDGVAYGTASTFALGSFTPTTMSFGSVSGDWNHETYDLVAYPRAMAASEVLAVSGKIAKRRGYPSLKPWNMWMVWGQSNALGQAQWTDAYNVLGSCLAPMPFLKSYTLNGTTFGRDVAWHAVNNSASIPYTASAFGPEGGLGFVSNQNDRLAVAAVTWSGQSIVAFLPGTNTYTEILARVAEGLKQLGPNSKFVGTIQFQGEADSANSTGYDTELATMYNGLKTDLSMPALKIIIARMSNMQTGVLFGDKAGLNAKIDAFCAADTANRFALNTDDAMISIETDGLQRTHYPAQGHIEFARRMLGKIRQWNG